RPWAPIEGAVEVKTFPLGEAVHRLRWLSPGAASLVALARLPLVEAWPHLRHDPGAVLHLLRHAPATAQLAAAPFFHASENDPTLLENAGRWLSEPAFV